ncbi:potassium efflux system protein [Azotobacter beijerinckii]|uniref:Potassium efflux system protein n=1 Tax=Azotobacter beijerinckii TaxID=170623 RepID=A0A1H9EH93_9GAMM|nr:mechanosensitive channel MscK [Azotobacter beijerinckii]SEQ24907.1 potassium efflux system protein [Azotobacter beijerinckii]
MTVSRSLFSVLLLALCLQISGLQAAEPPPRKAVQASLDSLAERKLPEAEQAAVKQQLEQTLAQLDLLQESAQAMSELKRQLAAAPQQTKAAQRELAALKETPQKPAAPQNGHTPLPRLMDLLSTRNAQLSEWQQALNDANSLLVSSQTRPERAQTEIAANQARILEINTLLKSGKQGGKTLGAEGRGLLEAELAALEAKTALRRQELAGNSQLLELGASQRDLLQERIQRQAQEIAALQALVNEKRMAMSEETFAELSRDASAAGSDSLLAKETATNLKLSDALLRTTDRLNALTRQNLDTKHTLDNLVQNEQALEEQIEVLRGSLLLAKILFQQKLALPHVQIDKRLTDEIGDIRLYQFELGQQRSAISDPDAYVERLLAKQAEEEETPVDPALRSSLLELANSRSGLIERLDRELNALLNEAITLQLNQKQLLDTAGKVGATLEEQLFWIPSNKPLGLEWLKAAPQRLQEQIASISWGPLVKDLGAGLIQRPLIFLPLLLLIGVLVWQRGAISHKLDALHADIGHYRRDSQRHTPKALLLNLLLALPGTLFLALGGYTLQMDARGQNPYLGAALNDMALAWLVLYGTYKLLAEGGVAELHFGWPRPQVAFLRRQIRHFTLVVLALVGVIGFARNQPGALDNDVLGVLVLLSGYALLAWLLGKLLLRHPTQENASPLNLLVGILFTLLPIGLIVGLALGYYYTALRLGDRLIESLYALLVWVVAEATLVRGLSVAARRLAYQRALAKRQSAAADGGENGEVVEEPNLDIEQVNQQSLRLIRLTLFGLLLGALYWVWADLITVVDYLDNVTLYEFTSGSGATASLVPISLRDLLAALLIAALTVVLARNLPGLLEMLILSRLNLGQGSAYATTTLLNYVIFGFGIVSALSTLGVSWDKLQWLVAALSVGIGFGMQEIIANFISGLIILFERPVRIGDQVTVGGVSGSVSKIRIRATHIIDADRKVVIVPNKTFITSQLTNWTLADTVTRLVLKVGVGYGSNLDRVRELLYQAANENPRVLREPPPLVLFQTFGESTLDHDLILHVRELADRGRATDEINRRIDELFRENHIDIAFRQVEVFVKNAKGQEQLLENDEVQAALGAVAVKPGTPPEAGKKA